jgi:hypothetical protein
MLFERTDMMIQKPVAPASWCVLSSSFDDKLSHQTYPQNGRAGS